MPEASDFRYYMHDGSAAFSFELAGRLSDEGARELQQTWQTASSMIGDRSLIVDLSYISGIDGAGQKLLRGWHEQGAQFVVSFPLAHGTRHGSPFSERFVGPCVTDKRSVSPRSGIKSQTSRSLAEWRLLQP